MSTAKDSPGDTPGTTPKEGSSLYYALWGVSNPQRQRALDRLALGRSLNEALLDVSTPEVAQQKLHWWHEEIDRWHRDAARHPSTQACSELAGDTLAREAALDILGAGADERYQPADSQDNLEERLLRSARAQLRLCVSALENAPTQPLAPTLDALALGLAQHQRLARLPELLSAGQAVFADSLFHKHALQPGDLLSRESALLPKQSALIDDAIHLAMSRLEPGVDAAEDTWPRGHAARPLATLGRLRLRQLKAWSHRKTPLAQAHYSLPPIVKLWIAWRHR